MIAILLVFYLLAMLIAIGVFIMYIFYLITLSQCLKQCAPHNQRMTPGEVWMVFIPLFGLVWHFFVVGRVADSLAAEFRTRGREPDEPRPGYQTGLTALILMLIPFAGIVGVVFLGIYWSKMSKYKKQLESMPLQFGYGNPYPFPDQFPGQQQYYAGQYPQQGQYPGAQNPYNQPPR